MSWKELLLQELISRRGGYTSGEALARQFGVSRTAVCKAVAALRRDGFGIDSAPNLGYRLLHDPRPFTAEAVYERLNHRDFYHLRLQELVDSTNRRLKEAAAAGAPQGEVLFAFSQTDGHGRQGRAFYSPFGTGLYMSMLLRPALSPRGSLLLTTAAAVAVAEAAEKWGVHLGIKWVNDLFLQGKKVCGILTEGALSLECDRLEYAVVGMGLNLAPPPGGFPPELEGVAGALFSAPPESGVTAALAAAILDEFYDLYADLSPERFYDRYARRSILTGRRVWVEEGGTREEAEVLGLDRGFRLLVRFGSGEERALSAGEVHLRLAEA